MFGSLRGEIRNLTIMLVTFDVTFLLWVAYYALLVPRVVQTKQPENIFLVNCLCVVIGSVLGVTPQCIIMIIHYRNFKSANVVVVRQTQLFEDDSIRQTQLLEEDSSDCEEQRPNPGVNSSGPLESY